MMSPRGASILIASAPRSARIWVASGPRTTVVRSSTLMPASGPGFAAPTPAPGSCIVRSSTLPRSRPDPKEEGDAGDDVPQPALQYLAQDLGAAARERRRAQHHRVSEEAAVGGRAEKD